MKKVCVVTLVALMTLLLAGCGGKEQKLVCKQNTEGVDVTFNIGFKGNMIKTMDFNYDMSLAGRSDAEVEAISKQDFCSSIKDAMSEYKEAFTNCEHRIETQKVEDGEEKHLRIESVLDVDKIAKNTLDKMGSIESGKEALESQGYTCTIK